MRRFTAALGAGVLAAAAAAAGAGPASAQPPASSAPPTASTAPPPASTAPPLAGNAQRADGIALKGKWTNGGQAWLELEDRNVLPEICFIWDNPAPQDGDGVASRILTRAGAEVVDLGTADQWINGSGEGCEIPADPRYRDVFTRPGDYVVEFTVVENQGTPATPPVRSQPLQAG